MDYHEMFENWTDGGYHEYDPAWIHEDDRHNNNPVDTNDWARDNEDFDGGP